MQDERISWTLIFFGLYFSFKYPFWDTFSSVMPSLWLFWIEYCYFATVLTTHWCFSCPVWVFEHLFLILCIFKPKRVTNLRELASGTLRVYEKTIVTGFFQTIAASCQLIFAMLSLSSTRRLCTIESRGQT